MTKKLSALALVVVATLAIGACSASSTTEPAASPAADESVAEEPAEASTDGITTIVTNEYSFEIPEITAGEQELVLQNDGEQVHMAAIVQLLDGKTVEDAMDYIAENGVDSKPPTWAKDVGFGIADPGQTAPISTGQGEPTPGSMIDLVAGDYVALCFIPDGMTSSEDKPDKGAKSHAELGMVQGFTVS